MKYTQFENHLKSELYNATAFVDTNSLINNIHSINNTKDRKKPLILLLLFILAISIPFGLYNFNKNNSNNKMILPIFKKDKNQKSTNIKEAVQPINNNNKSSNDKEKINTSIASSTQKTKIFNKTHLKDIIKQEKKLNTKNKKQIVNSNKPVIITYTKESIQLSSINNSIDINNQLKSNSIENTNFIAFKNIKKKSFFLNHSIDQKGLFNNSLIPGDPTGCYSFGPRFRLNWFLGVEIGILKPFKRFSNSNPDFSTIYDIRNKNEKPLEALQATIFTKVMRDDIPFYLKLGIKYTRITDRLKYKYSYIEHDTIQGIISITESENGDTLTIIRGDIIRDIVIDRNISQHYYFHQFDIPLTLGYRFGFKGFDLEAELGAMFNIRTSTTGKIMNAPNTITPVKEVNMFKKSIGFSYFAGINIVKEVSYKGQMFAGFRFRYLPNSFSLKSNPITQKYNLVGFHLGYMYNLSKRSFD